MKKSEVKKVEVGARGIKFFIERDGKEIARAYLYLLSNELHTQPFGLLEDVFVVSEFRNKGYGIPVIRMAVETAEQQGCYKLLCTSRHGRTKNHQLCEKMGFKSHGVEFRMDFPIPT
jgi:GNAT superfamily N-acetyltransferase